MNNKIKPNKQTRYLSQAIQLEEAVNPRIIQATMLIVSLCLISFVIWASFTNINEIARTPGEVIPQGYQQTVQHLEGGVVHSIQVQEGDIVKPGQTLIVLDDSSIKEDLQRVEAKQLDLVLQAERLRAFIEGRQPNFNNFAHIPHDKIIDQQSFFEGMLQSRTEEQNITKKQIDEKIQSVKSLEAQLQTAKSHYRIADDVYQRRKKLNSKGYASDMQLLEDKREVNQYEGEMRQFENRIIAGKAAIVEYQNRAKSLVARHKDEALERLSNIMAEKSQNIKIIDKLKERISRLNITSPAQGLIKGLTINTVGAVIQPGQNLMEVIPLDKELIVAVKISPKDIGHLKVGQAVQVKFSSFDFSRYGSIRGTLNHISATTFSSNNDERYYQGRIILDKNYVGGNPDNIIIPGMTVMADVITGEKTILQYMLKPIHISLKTAFTER